MNTTTGVKRTYKTKTQDDNEYENEKRITNTHTKTKIKQIKNIKKRKTQQITITKVTNNNNKRKITNTGQRGITLINSSYIHVNSFVYLHYIQTHLFIYYASFSCYSHTESYFPLVFNLAFECVRLNSFSNLFSYILIISFSLCLRRLFFLIF